MFSEKLNLVFVHVPKSAGTSVIESVRRIDETASHGHHRLSHYRKKIEAGAHAFAIVRNPWDRIISSYCYARMAASFWHKAESASQHPDFVLCRGYDFEEVVNRLYRVKEMLDEPEDFRGKFGHNWSHQYRYLDCDLPVDLFRFEELTRVEEYLSRFSVTLAKLNTSQRVGEYRDYFNKRTQRMVAEIYQKDIERFGYEF